MADKSDQKSSRRAVGRPRKYQMPEPIDDSAENIARAVLATRPKKREEWDHLRETPDPEVTD